MVFELTWKVTYNDGLTFYQNRENKYPKIDRSKLSLFQLLKGDKVVLSLDLDNDKNLFYRRRVSKSFGGKEEVVYLVGWHSGNKEKEINYIFEDGHIETNNEWISDHKWFYKPKLHSCEN